MTNETTTTVDTTAAATEASKPAKKATAKKASKPAKKAAKAAPKKASKPAKAAPKKAKPAGVTTGSVIPASYRSQYKRSKIEAVVVDADGKKTKKAKAVVDNGDSIAELLRGKALDAVYQLVAKRSGVAESDLRSRYSHLNVGMQRMNLGNKLRALV